MNILMIILSWIFKPTLNLVDLIVIVSTVVMFKIGVPLPAALIFCFIGGIISGIGQRYFKNNH